MKKTKKKIEAAASLRSKLGELKKKSKNKEYMCITIMHGCF
jgi:hypothetical protein